jgi:undecaprenyl-diphosphatase
MDFLNILLLAFVQGVTEFLPISSSGHLILAPYLFDFNDQGLALDVAVHLGSLLAVVSYFRRDVVQLSMAWVKSLAPHSTANDESRLAWNIVIATMPVILAGLLLHDFVKGELRAPWVIATTTILFGLLLAWADWRGKRTQGIQGLSVRNALFIGLAQILALIPGTSRSGITMTAGLMLGLSRQAAARFSFLLSIPTILAASLFVTMDLLQSPQAVDWNSLLTGLVLSAAAAYLCIYLFLRFIERIGMWPFVVYRLVLGLVIFSLI